MLRPLPFGRRARLCGLAVVAFSSLLLSGCVLGVAWLPDSSGFFYAEKAKEGLSLTRFDVATKKRTVVVEDTKTMTLWPAVSPDGKQIAVARWWTEKGKRDTLQVIIYDLEGKAVKRSKVFPWVESKKDKSELDMTFLAWGTRGQVLVWAKDTAIYDVARDKIEKLPGGMAFPGSSNNPVRPDGKGFLALMGDKPSHLAFVDWAGKETKIEGDLPEGDDFPWGYTLTWQKDVAVLSGRAATLRVDTDKKKLKKEASTFPKLLPGAEGKVEAAFAFPNSKHVVCVFRREKADPARPNERDSIELQNPAAETRKVIVPTCDVSQAIFFPSPDRKKVVLRYQEGVVKNERILVIDETGKVLAHFLAGGHEED